MKIDGTDPLVLNKIQNKVSRQEVQSLGETDTDPKVTTKGKSEAKQLANSNKPDLESLELSIVQANDTVDALNIGLRFKLHESSERYMVQIIDREKNSVIKEIPPERLLNLVGQIQEMIGVLLDEKR